MKVNYLIIWLFLFVSCSNLNITDKLELHNGVYCSTSDVPFSGQLITRFENGNISNVTNFDKGIPSGKWFVYGYKKEIIQNGEYIPVKIIDQFKKDVFRINICTTQEGSIKFVDVIVVYNIHPPKKEYFEKALCDTLKKRGFYCQNVREIKYLKGELEDY